MKTTVQTKQDQARLELERLMASYLKKRKIKKVPRGASGLDPEALAADWGANGGWGLGSHRFGQRYDR